ncbi:MAG: hypothetical protein ABSH56_27905 [Bryobacteraceae bacterium]|jgi:pimeloyl-ACP methyl ester carboxylesterase
MSDRRRVLFSIHGIRTEGEWQEAFQDVFEPHFRFVSFKYGEFRHPIGAVFWLALELWVILAGGAAALLAWRFHWLHGLRAWAIAFLTWLLLCMVASILANLRRNRVVKNFITEVDRQVKYERDPHVVAHSLGSFIVGRVLQRYPERNFSDIILMGCVLGRKYAWRKIAHRFEMVRNEVSGRDWVSAVAVCLKAFIPEMGAAGIGGFAEEADFVRTLDENEFGVPWRPCLDGCVCGFGTIASPDSRVLNVPCTRLGHLDMAKHRARLVWLPFLWNIAPGPYADFIKLCQNCADFESQRLHGELRKEVTKLTGSCWFWTRGPLVKYVQARLEDEMGPAPAEMVLFTVRNLWRTVTRAAQHDATPQDQVCLHPIFAVQVAVAATVATLR